jgi:hypothetical protein
MLIIYDTLVLGLELPPTVNAAINRKIEQYYLVQEYGFRVEREKKESERKQIEAYGIRDFQQTVTQGISDSYVRWRGIEATLQLAQIAQHQDRDHRQRQGRPAGHPRQRRYADPAEPGRARGAAGAATLPDNSEGPGQRPAGASPPLLEKNSGQQSAEARRNGRRRPEAARTTPAGSTPSADTSGRNAKQANWLRSRISNRARRRASRTSWTWSEIQDLISRTVGSGAPAPELVPAPATGQHRTGTGQDQPRSGTGAHVRRQARRRPGRRTLRHPEPIADRRGPPISRGSRQ